MSSAEWNKTAFKDFVDTHGIDLIVEYAPDILYSKKDKEHEAFYSLVAFFFLAGSLLIYIALSLIFMEVLFNLPVLITVVALGGIGAAILLLNYIKSNVYIKPIECWIEIFEGSGQNGERFYCFSYYPVFSGKCHPNKAKNIVYKLFQEEILGSTIDVTQIELYLKINSETSQSEPIGLHFQYGEGKRFSEEEINRHSWKFFPYQENGQELLATANWDHQYEWKEDLALDFDKLHNYAPWIIQRWNENTIKPLLDSAKKNLNWDKRPVESQPKLTPWTDRFETENYQNPKAYIDLEVIEDTLARTMGEDFKAEKLQDVKDNLFAIRAHFRDLNS